MSATGMSVSGHSTTRRRTEPGAAHLSELAPGQIATISAISGETVTRLHLMEMGLTPGTEVKVIRVAAFGGPLDIQVRGYRLSIRRAEAQAIVIAARKKE
jgi:Fe2+ transport system protein FeoA